MSALVQSGVCRFCGCRDGAPCARHERWGDDWGFLDKLATVCSHVECAAAWRNENKSDGRRRKSLVRQATRELKSGWVQGLVHDREQRAKKRARRRSRRKVAA